MIVKIFWKRDCPHCPSAKELGKELERRGTKVEYHNVEDVDGLSEATFFGVMSTPSIILVKGNEEIMAWRGKTPPIKEATKYL